MKILNKILAFFSDIKEFLLCFLRGSCIYSIKKLLAFFTFALITYLAVFQQNVSAELLIFLAALLGLREYSKYNYRNTGNKPDDKINNEVG